MAPAKKDEKYSEPEARRRLDAALRAALSTPPKPRSVKSDPKKKRKAKLSQGRG
jgi:hypothetical protein